MDRKKICFVVAIPASAQAFLKDHIKNLSNDYDVYLAGNIKDNAEVCNLAIKGWKHIDINRQISIAKDIKAVFQLRKYFTDMKFDAVHSVTPKAGLVTALAGFLAYIPIRIHIFTGQVWATKQGLSKKFLMGIDRFISNINTHILVDGNSQRKYLIDNKILKKEKAIVLGDGSISGVNTERFSPNPSTKLEKRQELGIPDNKTVFIFMGRLNRDKGLFELLPAFNKLASSNPNVFLLLFGRDEENIASTFPNYKNLNQGNFLYYGATPEPQNMLQAGDIFVLPTYREGFGSSVIEAACLGLPTITSDAYGVLDASEIGVTGLQCKVGDSDTLYEAMSQLANNKKLADEMGKAGRKRVLEKFSGEVVTRHWKGFYHNLLN